MACGILVPPPGVEPMPLALEAWSVDHLGSPTLVCFEHDFPQLGKNDWALLHVSQEHRA